MSGCIVCKISNATLEMKKHTNQQTIFILKSLLKRLKERNTKDIEKICENCRIPIKINTILTTAGNAINNVYNVRGEQVYLEIK